MCNKHEQYTAETEDGREVLNKTKISDLARNYDAELLTLLQSDAELKKHFFTAIDENVLVFKLENFLTFISNFAHLSDSFTAFKKKIGLATDKDHYLCSSREVVLNWAYKDCILEGGQTKEDQKRNEVFFNEIIAPDQINRLLDNKVFTNWKRYNAVTTETQENRNLLPTETTTVQSSNCTELKPTDNLIIKGNNLVVLHSLKKRFAGKVKLIYIDPPYNTGNDSFKYNDNFNHSTWLTFMKNRLSVAKELLKDDGVICVQCSFHEQSYLKVLMDEIFPKYLCTFNIQVRHPDRILTGDKEFNDIIEYTLFYSNNNNTKMPKRVEAKLDDEYIFKIVEKGIPQVVFFDNKKVEIFTPDQYSVIQCEANSENTKKISVRGSIREKNSSGRLYVKHIEPIALNYPSETLFKVENMGDDNLGFRYFYTPPQGNKNGGYYQGKPQSSDITEKPYANFYNFEEEYNNVAEEGSVSFRNGKKPEEYISFLMNIFTNPHDLVLDFHLGSGTTCAVAHKMGRQYIGIEQLDYGENDSIARLQNVINGDQTGISKFVNWQGGGEFVYCELANDAENFRNEVRNAKANELPALLAKAKQSSFLSYRVNKEQFNDFETLNEDEQRTLLLQLVDANMLYINYSDLENKDFDISEEDKKLNKQFYKEI